MDVLSKKIVYTVIKSELYHNSVPITFFLPESSMKIIIYYLDHTIFRFKYVSPKM